MNAIHPHHGHTGTALGNQASNSTLATRRRRWAIGAALVGAFLGLYVLGLVWFAGQLRDDMQSTLQLAPSVQDTAHRGD